MRRILSKGWAESPTLSSGVQKKLFVELDEEEKAILERLKSVPCESLDNIAIAKGFPIGKTASLLLKLEMKGYVKPLPCKFFEWV